MSHNKFHVTQDEPHRWRNIEELVYKDEDGAATFKDVTRRVLFGEDHADGGSIRQFLAYARDRELVAGRNILHRLGLHMQQADIRRIADLP